MAAICTDDPSAAIAGIDAALAAGADVNAHDERRIGETTLSRVVHAGNTESVESLLTAGADPTIPGWTGLSAIHRAQMGGARLAPILELIRQTLVLPDRQWSGLLLPEKPEL